MTGRKADHGKPRFDLMPPSAELAVAEVLTFGAQKYADENWRSVSDPLRRYYAALRRHLNAWKSGEKTDPETGLPHLAHAGCCLLFMLDLDLNGEPPKFNPMETP